MEQQDPLLTLIHGGDVYAPEPLGVHALLLAHDTIAHLGPLDQRAVAALDLPCRIVDAGGCLVTPGLIDPHQHLIGAGGEEGWGTRLPEVTLEQIVRAGITSVVGVLGTDTLTRQLPALLGKVRELHARGISAYMYTGGFPVPPPTITGAVQRDLVLLDPVIGLGEIAIADVRSSQPTLDELAQLVAQTMVGGKLSGKAGVTHFHIGPSRERLALLRALIEHRDIPPRTLYPTHINRSPELLEEAIALARQGAYVDIDTADDDLELQLRLYRERGGPLTQLTISSDAHTAGGSPAKLYRNIVAAARAPGLALADVLPLCTRNPAAALALSRKGRLAVGLDADLLVLRRDTLEIVHVFARGRQLVADGAFVGESQGGAA